MVTPITFAPTGPNGFLERNTDISLGCEKLIEGRPLGGDHCYFQRAPGLRAGIWHSGPYTEWFESYFCDEFMYILEGQVFVYNDEFSESYERGSAFLLPKGFRGYWSQPVHVTKYYMAVE